MELYCKRIGNEAECMRQLQRAANTPAPVVAQETEEDAATILLMETEVEAAEVLINEAMFCFCYHFIVPIPRRPPTSFWSAPR